MSDDAAALRRAATEAWSAASEIKTQVSRLDPLAGTAVKLSGATHQVMGGTATGQDIVLQRHLGAFAGRLGRASRDGHEAAANAMRLHRALTEMAEEVERRERETDQRRGHR